MSDEELQERTEKGNFSDDKESRAYAKVFEALHQEPEFVLPLNFAENVISQLDLPLLKSSRDVVWLYAGFVACVLAMVVAVVLTGFKVNFGALKFISGSLGLVVFGVLFVIALQWVDRKMVRN
jgi:hypothetical protein